MTTLEIKSFARLVRRQRRGRNVAFRGHDGRLCVFSFLTLDRAERFAAKNGGKLV